jgi:hypothetical protein
MKLLYCTDCRDIVRIYSEARFCKCGKSGACYADDHNARVTGPGRIIGVDTERFYRAVQAAVQGCGRIDRWPDGTGFEAFIAPTYWPTVKGPDEREEAESRRQWESFEGSIGRMR